MRIGIDARELGGTRDRSGPSPCRPARRLERQRGRPAARIPPLHLRQRSATAAPRQCLAATAAGRRGHAVGTERAAPRRQPRSPRRLFRARVHRSPSARYTLRAPRTRRVVRGTPGVVQVPRRDAAPAADPTGGPPSRHGADRLGVVASRDYRPPRPAGAARARHLSWRDTICRLRAAPRQRARTTRPVRRVDLQPPAPAGSD